MMLLDSLFNLKTTAKIPRQVLSRSWEDRHDILSSDVNLFCWNRHLDKTIVDCLERGIDHWPQQVRVLIHRTELDLGINTIREHWPGPEDHGLDLFWEDIARLAYDFLAFSEDGSGTLHLKVVHNDACTKFHLDGYNLRLFTTYFGPGTEWLPEKAVNRAALGTSNDRIVKDTSQIRRMKPFEVGILKGEIQGHQQLSKGIVHRSPELQFQGQKRIILRIDL